MAETYLRNNSKESARNQGQNTLQKLHSQVSKPLTLQSSESSQMIRRLNLESGISDSNWTKTLRLITTFFQVTWNTTPLKIDNGLELKKCIIRISIIYENCFSDRKEKDKYSEKAKLKKYCKMTQPNLAIKSLIYKFLRMLLVDDWKKNSKYRSLT